MNRSSFPLLSILAVVCASAAVAAEPPVGLDALRLDQLPLLRPTTRALQASSYQRDGGNADRGNYLQTVGSEYVMLDVQGPGCIYRLWMTGFDSAAHIRIYFDNAASPTVDMTLDDFFRGDQTPFLLPLVGNNGYSSGGFICCLPMPFREACRITTTSANDYYNITYHRFADAGDIVTFDGAADSSAIAATWENVGTDPKTDAGTQVITGTVTVPAGGTVTLADLPNRGTIQALELTIPGLDASSTTAIWDDGRAHVGSSAFDVAIDPANTGVRLIRRLDYSIGNQKANVYVDGSLVGEWYDAGAANNKWLDSTFVIPDEYTAGKSSIHVRVSFVSADYDWNEFTYWVASLVAGEPVETDTVDVGNAASETAHNYTIVSQTWSGSGTRFYYDPDVITVTDDGRATQTSSEFDLALDPNNTGARLIRRLDYTIADQRAAIYIDGTYAGEMFTEGSAGSRWLDATFDIPAAFTAGKSTIHVKVAFVSSALDWNEFRYWLQSVVAGDYVQTDELDVDNTTSETVHNYVIQNPTWDGARTFEYYQPEVPNPYLDVIQQVRLVATFDNAAAPQIDVPIGGLCGSNIGPSEVRALPVGIIGDRLYCYLPMPYDMGAALTLTSTLADPVSDVAYTIRYTPFATPGDLHGLGRLHAVYREEAPCTVGSDYTILDVTGAGHFVGVVQTSAGPNLGYLEGDERIYIDGSRTPQLQGTGTEDFYNGGWYFSGGRFTLPTHGNPTMTVDVPVMTDMYRYFLSDLIPFTMSLHVGIEHGAYNETADTDIYSVALYYAQDAPLAALTDDLDVGNTTSETAHNYAITNQTSVPTLTDEYEGDHDDIRLTDSGRHHAGTSTFTVALDPYNAGVLLRRQLNYQYAQQEASVTVDGTPAGRWYDAGSNSYHRWRDSELVLPAALTEGKSSITVSLTDISATSDWTEYHYWVYSLRPPQGIPGDANCSGKVDFFDIDPFVVALTGETGYASAYPNCDYLNADTNGDGEVNFFDIDPFVVLLTQQ